MTCFLTFDMISAFGGRKRPFLFIVTGSKAERHRRTGAVGCFRYANIIIPRGSFVNRRVHPLSADYFCRSTTQTGYFMVK